jgi:hypothetical protein
VRHKDIPSLRLVLSWPDYHPGISRRDLRAFITSAVVYHSLLFATTAVGPNMALVQSPILQQSLNTPALVLRFVHVPHGQMCRTLEYLDQLQVDFVGQRSQVVVARASPSERPLQL